MKNKIISMSLNCYRGQFEEIGNENKQVRHVMFQNSTNPAALTHWEQVCRGDNNRGVKKIKSIQKTCCRTSLNKSQQVTSSFLINRLLSELDAGLLSFTDTGMESHRQHDAGIYTLTRLWEGRFKQLYATRLSLSYHAAIWWRWRGCQKGLRPHPEAVDLGETLRLYGNK